MTAAPVRQRARELREAAIHRLGDEVDEHVMSHYERRLERVGWRPALDADGIAWSSRAVPPTTGNSVDVLVDGATMLPAVAEALQAAESHAHILGWYFTPELDLTRDADPVVLRNVLADLAERVDVRVLGWKGAPLPVFQPTRREVNRAFDRLTRGTRIRACVDNCVRVTHCHHEKVIVIDDRVAFVGGIDLTLDGGDPFDTPRHRARGRIGWHDVAVRVEGPAVADLAQHFRLRWERVAEERLPEPTRAGQAGGVELQVVRTIPEHVYSDLDEGEFSILESYTGALRSAEKLVYLENQFLWSPEITATLADKLR